MKILITTPVFPPDVGGPATFVPLFASYLADRGHQVRVVTFAEAGGRLETAAGYPVFRVARTFLPLRYVRFAVQVFRLARQSEVVFCCEHPRLFTVMATRLLGRRLVLRMMVDTAWEQSFRLGLTKDSPEAFRARRKRGLEWVFQKLQTWSLRQADAVVAVSRHLAATALEMMALEASALKKGAGKDRVWVSYNLPAEGLVEDEQATEPLGFSSGKAFRILVVARLVPWKGVAAVVEAVERSSRDPAASPIELVILGDGPCRPELERRIDATPGLNTVVRLLGAVSQESARRHMGAADLLILNSRYEGLSHVVLEAFEAELPVLVAENPGNLELVTHGLNGECFPHDDVEELVRRIRRSISDPERLRAHALEGRRRVDQWRAAEPFRRLEERLSELIRGRDPEGFRDAGHP